MWIPFWRPRDRFSLDELRYLTDQLQTMQVVNKFNKDFVVEALRSIAELVTYGDQHDPSFFEFFMEQHIMGEFVRILEISRSAQIALQLLQTLSIIIQNLRSESAIYYIFSTEYINYLITYSFDFRNDELLSYYISFLRATSGKLNKNTISLLVKTQNDEVVSFPLYTEAIRFAFHEESMVRIAVRALTLNIYHVGDGGVNRYVSRIPLSDYFSNSVKYFRKQCLNLDGLISQAAANPDSSEFVSRIFTAVDEIENTMYYYSDVISSMVPALGKLITDNILELLVFPLLLPCLRRQNSGEEICIHSSLYLLCYILRIIKTRDLASAIAASLFYPPEAFIPKTETIPNGSDTIQQSEAGRNDYCYELSNFQSYQQSEPRSLEMQDDNGSSLSSPAGSSQNDSPCYLNSQSNSFSSYISLRELLLSYVVSGDNLLVLGSLSLLATLLQTKELDESMLDGLGILPQRKQHKKLLLQALVGEGSGEEQLFSSVHTELDGYLEKLGEQYGQLCCCGDLGISPQKHRSQVLDALVGLFCRGDLSADTLWTGGWLLRQLLPNGEEGFTNNHLIQLKDSDKSNTAELVEEIRGSWCDMLIAAVMDEWRNCKRALEAASPHQDPKSILLPSRFCPSEGESCISAGERMCEMVKIFVLQRQLLILSSGGYLHDHLPVQSPKDYLEHFRAKTAGLDVLDPKLGSEINLENALPCTITFRRGKEHHLYFLAISWRTSGWILLAEQLPLKQQCGVLRIFHPLAGSEPRIDEKYPKWLHLRIRPSNLPSRELSKYDAFGKGRPKVMVDGRWTLAFKDEQACKSAESMLVEEMHLQHREVEKRVKPFLELDPPHEHTTGPSH